MSKTASTKTTQQENQMTAFENPFESNATPSNVDPTADMDTYESPVGFRLKVAVVGSRDYADVEYVNTVLDAFHAKYTADMVVSGGAKGADTIGAEWAQANDIQTHIHEARWNEGPQTGSGRFGNYNPRAGHNRNTAIVRDADVVIAFTTDWSKSRGTGDTIKKAHKSKTPTFVFDAKQGQYFTNPAAQEFVKKHSK